MSNKAAIFFFRSATIGAIVLVFILLAVSGAEAKYASIVIDAQTGKVRHAVNADTRNYPASLTKLMTLYLLFEAVDQKKMTFNSRLSVSRRAANRPASRLGLKRGQSIRVKDAVMALIIKSANDVASVVAEGLAGDERRFALLMTAKARKLGMSRTTFRNASGLPHRGQLSTARDMSTLARSIYKRFPHYYHLFKRTTFTFQGHTYRTHNKVLKYYAGAEGMKTGYIRASGYNLVTSSNRKNHRLIGVVFGGNTPKSRDRHMVNLLNRTYKKIAGTVLMANAAKSRTKRKVTGKSNSQNNVWGIQVGAFYSKNPAYKLANTISKKYARVLKNGKIKVMPLYKSRNRVLYRARILGIGKRSAYRVCRLLKKNRRPCLELRLPGEVELASRQ